AYQNCLRIYANFATEFFPASCISVKYVEVKSQRNYRELLPFSNSKPLTNLHCLLLTNNYNSIGGELREDLFDQHKQARFHPAVVTMKNVSMVRVNEFALAQLADQNSGSQPAINEAGNSAYR